MTASIDFDPARRDAIAAKMNLSVLQRADPAVKKVLKLASHVCLYQLDDSHSWRRLDIEGSLFVVELHVNHPNNAARARHRIVIINRKSLDNYSDDVVVGNKEIELQEQMIMYTNSKQQTIGIWFYQKQEASSLFQLLQTLVERSLPTPPSSPSAQTASASQTVKPSVAQPSDSSRPPETSPRARRAQKRVARNVKTRQSSNSRPHASADNKSTRAETQTTQPNSLERFFPALKHTHGVAGATLPPDVNTSSVMESVAVTTLTSNADSIKQNGTEFKPTSEIDEAIVIASDNGLPDAILSKSSSSSDQLMSDAMKLLRAKADNKPRSDPRRKSSPKTKPAPKVTTPLKVQRPKRAQPAASKPAAADSNAQRATATSSPLYSEPSEPRHNVERRKRSPPSAQKSLPERKPASNARGASDTTSVDVQAGTHIASTHPQRASKKNVPDGAQIGSQPVQTAQQEALARRLEAQGAASSASTAAKNTPAKTTQSNDTKPHSAVASVPQSSGSEIRQRTAEVNAAPATASAALSSLNVSRAMEEAQRHLQTMSMPQEGLNLPDPLLRSMAPFRFPSGNDMQLGHTAAMMPSPIAPPPQPPAPFPAGLHPQMAMLMQHQLFLQQQQFLAQQEHQRRMQMQNMPLPSVPMMHKSEARSAPNVPNGHSSSQSTSAAANSAADLMRMLNAGGAKADAQSSGKQQMTEEEKGKHIARSVASADRKGQLASSLSDKMDRSEFRAVVQRMLTDKRLFESVYANYVSASEN